MKRKVSLAVMFATAGITLAGCSSTPTADDIAEREAEAQEIRRDAAIEKMEHEQEQIEEMMDAVPDWAITPPQSDSEGVYAVGMGKSKTLDTALKKASLQAQYALAKAYKQELSGNERSYVQENANIGVTEQYTQLIDTLVDSVRVVGFRVIEQEVVPLQGKFNAYTLVKLPYEQFNTMLQQSKNETTSTDIRLAFKELEERLEKRRINREAQSNESTSVDIAAPANETASEL